MVRDGSPDQIAYLSNRPEVLAQTLTYVRHFLPWVRQAVVLCPASSVDPLRRALADREGPEVVLIDEDALLTASERTGTPGSHTARNVYLRRVFVERGPLDDVFLQSDDDYRPLKPVAPSLFVQDGRLISYAFYDLALWRRNESPYDAGQRATYLVLSYLGAPHLCFASHMPQAIDKQLFVEAFDAAARLTPSSELCEWSLPLNYGRLVAPERFGDVRTFRTMCWPRYPHEWPYWQRPEDLTFENFYPELYAPGSLFDGISTALDIFFPEQQAFEKIRRWHHFDVEAGRLRFPPDVANPWLTSRGRRAFFGAARGLVKADNQTELYEYVALEERTQLTELAGAVARLERTERS